MGTPGRTRVVLRGRDAEQEHLAQFVAEVAAGRGAMTYLAGEAGIGKSALLADAIEAARAQGFEVYSGRADEMEAERPLGALAGTDLARPGEAGPDGVNALDGSRPGQAAVDAVEAAIEQASARGPVLVVIDDAQWADPLTLAALARIERRLPELRVGLLVAARPHPVPDALAALRRRVDERHESIELGPLADAALGALVEDRLGSQAGDRLREYLGRAGGNPLWVTELLTALEEADEISTEGGVADVRGVGLPPGLALTVLRRLSAFPSATLEALRLAAILGSTFSVRDLATVHGSWSVAEATGHLDAPLQAGVVEAAGENLRFRHDVIREVVYDDVAEGVRRDLHTAAAEALLAAGATAAEVAGHLMKGSRPGDARAVRRLHDAARELAARSVGSALDVLEHASALADAGDATRDDLEADLVALRLAAGRYHDVIDLARRCLARGLAPAIESRVRLALSAALDQTGSPFEGVEEVRAASAVPGLDDEGRAVALAALGFSALQSADVAGAAATAREALALAPASDVVAEFAHQVLAVEAAGQGEVATALDHARRADRHARAGGGRPPVFVSVPKAILGLMLIEADDFAGARQAHHDGVDEAARRGRPAAENTSRVGLAGLAYFEGRFDDALAEAETGRVLPAEERGVAEIQALTTIGRVALHRGDMAAAEAAVEAGMALMNQPAFGFDMLMALHGLILDAKGEGEQARAVLLNAWLALEPLRYLLTFRHLAPQYVRAFREADPATAAAVTDATIEGARRAPDVPSATAVATLCEGLRDDDPDLLLKAVEAYRATPRAVDLAAARVWAGESLVGHGRAPEAAPVLDEAFEFFEARNATYDVGRIEDLRRSAGLGTRRRRTRSAPTVGWDALTDAEGRVVALVAEGLTNPQIAERLFISRRTVETHVSNVFRKLGVESRVHLALEVNRRAPTPDGGAS